MFLLFCYYVVCCSFLKLYEDEEVNIKRCQVSRDDKSLLTFRIMEVKRPDKILVRVEYEWSIEVDNNLQKFYGDAEQSQCFAIVSIIQVTSK